MRHAGRGVKGELEHVRQLLGLRQERVDLARVLDQVRHRALQQVIAREHARQVSDRGLEQTDRRPRLRVVDCRDVVEDLIHDIGFAHQNGRRESIHRGRAPAVSTGSSGGQSRHFVFSQFGKSSN